MFRRIIVGCDGSHEADGALALAQQLREPRGGDDGKGHAGDRVSWPSGATRRSDRRAARAAGRPASESGVAASSQPARQEQAGKRPDEDAGAEQAAADPAEAGQRGTGVHSRGHPGPTVPIHEDD